MDIYFYDLTENIQQALLDYMDAKTPEELGWDTEPIGEVWERVLEKGGRK